MKTPYAHAERLSHVVLHYHHLAHAMHAYVMLAKRPFPRPKKGQEKFRGERASFAEG